MYKNIDIIYINLCKRGGIYMSKDYQSSYKFVLDSINTNEPVTAEWIIKKCNTVAFQDAIDKKMIKYYDISELGIERYIITELGKNNKQ